MNDPFQTSPFAFLIQNFLVARINGNPLMEEEALMYQQLCRTVKLQARFQEIVLEDNIEKFELKRDTEEFTEEDPRSQEY